MPLKIKDYSAGFGLYGGQHIGLGFMLVIINVRYKSIIKAIKIGLYGGDKVGDHFSFISILKFRKCILNYNRNSGKMLIMTWLLMWLNEKVATLNATSQLLVLYRLGYHYFNLEARLFS